MIKYPTDRKQLRAVRVYLASLLWRVGGQEDEVTITGGGEWRRGRSGKLTIMNSKWVKAIKSSGVV